MTEGWVSRKSSAAIVLGRTSKPFTRDTSVAISATIETCRQAKRICQSSCRQSSQCLVRLLSHRGTAEMPWMVICNMWRAREKTAANRAMCSVAGLPCSFKFIGTAPALMGQQNQRNSALRICTSFSCAVQSLLGLFFCSFCNWNIIQKIANRVVGLQKRTPSSWFTLTKGWPAFATASLK